MTRFYSTSLPPGSRYDAGSTIILAMLILVVISLLGKYALDTSRVEVQIAGNEKVHRQTFYTAEGGWQVAVSWLDLVYPPITEAKNTTDLAKYLSGNSEDDRTSIAMTGNNQLHYAVDVQFSGSTYVPGFSTDFKRYNYVVNSTGTYADKAEVQVDVGAGKMFFVGGY